MSLLAKTGGCPRRPVETRGQELETHKNTRRAHTRQRETIPAVVPQVKNVSAQAHALHAPAGGRKCLEPDRRDLGPTPVADTVRPGGEPRIRRVDLSHLSLGVVYQCRDLRSLERDRRPFRIVFVIVGGPPRSFDHRRQFVPQGLESMLRTRPLGPECCSEIRHHTSRPRGGLGCRKTASAPTEFSRSGQILPYVSPASRENQRAIRALLAISTPCMVSPPVRAAATRLDRMRLSSSDAEFHWR